VAASAAAELLEERRLAYVALTRAERSLTVSGHWWGPSQTRARGPGPFLDQIRTWCEDNGGHIALWSPQPGDGETNPAHADPAVPWPAAADPVRTARVADVARAVREARSHPAEAEPTDDVATRAVISDWDADIAALLDEARRARAPMAVRVPDDLSATALVRLAQDPEAFARDLARPMPRQPHPAARLGTEMHAWIEGQYTVQTLFDLEELDAADDLDADLRLAELREAFSRTPYAARAPIAVEEPFALSIGGRVVRGRIDAVFATADGGAEVIDWKSGGRGGLSDLQLAIYRLAWAELSGMPLDRISAAFVMVRTGEVIAPARLLERVDVERILTGEDPR
jgi:DNA helicase-2/ATP-dependent DNA helicase PcrA